MRKLKQKLLSFFALLLALLPTILICKAKYMEAKAQGVFPRSERLFSSATMVPTFLTLLATILIYLLHHIITQLQSRHLNDRFKLKHELELENKSKFDVPHIKFSNNISSGSIGGILVVILFFMTQKIQSFYFTEDDNFSQFLPVILTAMESFFQTGRIHTWNPYQLFGSPTVEVGVYALTYPFTYVAFFIAKYFFGNKYATLEIFAFMHIFSGYWVTFFALRQRGIRASIATSGALSFVMSGFTLIAGRSWYYMLPGLVWIPFLYLQLSTLSAHRISMRWILLTACGIGLYFHAGNAQMWVYSIGFWLLAFLLTSMSKKNFKMEVLCVSIACCLGLSLCMPLAVPQSLFLTDIARDGGSGIGIYYAFLSLFIPYPFSQNLGFKNTDAIESLYYAGTWLPLFGLLSIVEALASVKNLWNLPNNSLKNWLENHAFAICLALVLLFALGVQGYLWTFLGHIPPFNKFNHPFKFLQLVSFFFTFSGAIYLDKKLSSQGNFGKWSGSALSVIVFLTLSYSVSHSRISFYTFADAPYPDLPVELRNLLQNRDQPSGRILTIAAQRDPAPQYVLGLPHNFPTVYGIHSMLGYDPLVGSKPENLFELIEILKPNPAQALRELGIRWVLVHRSGQDILAGKNKETMLNFNVAEIFQSMRPSLVLKLKLPELEVYENESARPLAFWEQGNTPAVGVTFFGQGVKIKVPETMPSADNLILNVLYRKNFQATINSERAAIKRDTFGRIHIPQVPPGATVELLYTPPWRISFLAAALFAGMGLFVLFLAKKMQKHSFSAVSAGSTDDLQ